MERKNKSHINPYFFVALFLFLTIGYAYLTSVLNINGSSIIKSPVWDVHFENIQVNSESVSGSQVIIEPTITDDTTVTFHVNLSKPGDFYEFTVDAVNAGTMDVMLSTTATFTIPEEHQAYLEGIATYADGEEILEHQQLLAGDTAIYKVKVFYKKDVESDDLPDDSQQVELSFGVNYIQKSSEAIERRAETNSLYNVLRREYENINGLAVKYNGAHQDSIDSSKSRKEIYHWYTTNDDDGIEITNRNNVLFADHCWQMFRTTDTGGVRLIYNGEVENNQCLGDRNNHVGYGSRTSINLASNYWYGTDYTYDKSSSTFKISSTVEQALWNETTSPGLIGKYTCRLANKDDTCSTLYLVESYYNDTDGYVIPLNSNSHYSQFGVLQFNKNLKTPASVGYSYGEEYEYSSVNVKVNRNFEESVGSSLASSYSLSLSFWYADSYTYDSNNRRYYLVNPYKVNSEADYSNLVGKYTFRSTNDSGYSSSIHYIYAIEDSTMYSALLSSGSSFESKDFWMSDSISNNGDGTYTLVNAVRVTLVDWFNNYQNYLHKFLCSDRSTSCASPHFIVENTKTSYRYAKGGKKIVIAKERDGLSLVDTLLLYETDLIQNLGNYNDYKYTCGDESTTCTNSTLRMIFRYYNKGYYYAQNYYYGSNVEWDGEKYTLKNTLEIEDFEDFNKLSTHHYFCANHTKTCEQVFYIFGNNDMGTWSSLSYYCMKFSDGEDDPAKLLDDMFSKNKTDSLMKKGVEAWYEHYLLKYDDYIDDTIYCNNRSIKNLNGWNPNGGDIDSYLLFSGNSFSNNISCPNVTDQFSISNNSAKLKYKVGLLTQSEKALLRNMNITKTGKEYWLMSPHRILPNNPTILYVFTNGNVNQTSDSDPTRASGVRPVISLSSRIEYESGDGSRENPYYIRTEYDG